MNPLRKIALALLAAVCVSPVAAGNADLGAHDSSAPISVAADDFKGDLNTRAGHYSGNVIVAQGDFKLHADQVDVLSEKGAIDHIVATGHVLFDAPNGQAKGDKGLYLIGPRTVTLTGDVVLTRLKNVMRGTQLVIDLQSGKSELTAHGAKGGRVTSLLTPPPRQAAKPAKDTPAAADGEKPK